MKVHSFTLGTMKTSLLNSDTQLNQASYYASRWARRTLAQCRPMP
jgi:hypothetical protein